MRARSVYLFLELVGRRFLIEGFSSFPLRCPAAEKVMKHIHFSCVPLFIVAAPLIFVAFNND
jgi:hypothetical protein